MLEPRFATGDPADFVIIGSGAAGGVLAKELATGGFDVVVLEQGPYLRAGDFRHDELAYIFNQELTGGWEGKSPQTFRKTGKDKAALKDLPPPAIYARLVGGSSVHFTGNYWRFHDVDFKERSLLGPIAGTGFADWPIDYAELEPYYTKVDWEVGVSGAAGPFDPRRSRPYPLPPLPVKSSGVLLERGAKKLGLHAFPAPMAVLSEPFNGRAPCAHCGYCMGFGCEMGAKSSSLAAMIPLAEASGRCEIRPECTAFRLDTDAKGRVSRVVYWDEKGREQAQQARAVVLSANGAETPRLMLASTSSRHPDGLANSSGKVGKYLMYNGWTAAYGLFEHPLNDYKSVQVTRIIHDFYDSDPKRGFYGGGGIDARPGLQATPMFFALAGLPRDAPRWGSEYKRMLSEYFTRSMEVNGHTTSLPLESNSVSLDPDVKDLRGRPALRFTYKDHPDDMAAMHFMQERSKDILEAAGAQRIWDLPVEESTITAHLLGTCRMGDDPAESVVDRYHRSHDVPNLFICDGSSLVTSGRGQPTMTIQALAFRAADHIKAFAKRGEI
ncbi:MAG: GMC family oxidoreductase [Gammaproteobacteria bacterium]|nr:GMC family oxidoreductase [Gammaproteobacteria bacterium]